MNVKTLIKLLTKVATERHDGEVVGNAPVYLRFQQAPHRALSHVVIIEGRELDEVDPEAGLTVEIELS